MTHTKLKRLKVNNSMVTNKPMGNMTIKISLNLITSTTRERSNTTTRATKKIRITTAALRTIVRMQRINSPGMISNKNSTLILTAKKTRVTTSPINKSKRSLSRNTRTLTKIRRIKTTPTHNNSTTRATWLQVLIFIRP